MLLPGIQGYIFQNTGVTGNLNPASNKELKTTGRVVNRTALCLVLRSTERQPETCKPAVYFCRTMAKKGATDEKMPGVQKATGESIT